MLVASFKDLYEIYYFQLNYIHNYIYISIVLNIREKGVVLTRRTLMKFWTLCKTQPYYGRSLIK